MHLRNAPMALMKTMGHRAGYGYVHEALAAKEDPPCQPDNLAGRKYHKP